MKLNKAYSYLSDVKDHKRVIPFRRFNGGVGRTGQAKEFKTTQGKRCLTDDLSFTHLCLGRWPEKSVKFIIRLLKNAESNADAKNIDVEDLEIKNIVVQQAPVSTLRLIQLSDVYPRLFVENSPPYISCPWSHQSIPRPSLPC